MLDDSDCDECDSSELDRTFNGNCRLLFEEQVPINKTFLLHLTGTSGAHPNIAVGTSHNSCEIYNLGNNQLARLDDIGEHSDTIVGIQFSPQSSDLLFTASVNGSIRLWDLRTPKKVAVEFTDTTKKESEQQKSIACFDVSPNTRVIAAGTELYEGEAFILYWDLRNNKLLGGYWESHTDDITQVKFHPERVDLLISGSTDGLINTYDLKQTSEDDALLDSLNTESSVEQLLWYKCNGNNCVCCITHTGDVQLWKTDAVEPYAHFRRLNIGEALRRKSASYCYVVSAHKCVNDGLFIIGGSNWSHGECVRGLKVNNNAVLEPMCMFKGNKQRVRSSWYNEHHDILATGGERGILNIWNVSS